jgi:hypothetical protein
MGVECHQKYSQRGSRCFAPPQEPTAINNIILATTNFGVLLASNTKNSIKIVLPGNSMEFTLNAERKSIVKI